MSSGNAELDTTGSDADTSPSFENFENPNFRKLYATLSVTSMMGCNQQDVPVNMRNAGVGAKCLGLQDVEDGQEKQDSNELPSGWEKHEDDNGPYYWHIPR